MKSPARPKMCIIVAGMHRSGTSAVTRVVNLLGADIARDLMPPIVGANDRGYWEPTTVVDIHNRLLHALGSSFDDPMPLPDRWFETEAAMAAKRQLADEIEKDFSGSRLFVVKDPRITRLLPLWLRLLDELGIEPEVVIPVRNPLEVAASFNKREGIGTAQSLLVYIRSYLETELASRDRRRFFVRYDQLLSDWRILARKLRKLVGPSLLPPKTDLVREINNFLTLDLHRNRFTREQLLSSPHIANTVVEMFDRMNEAADKGVETVLRTSFDQLRETVAEATKLFQGVVIAEQDKRRTEVGRLIHDNKAAVAQLANEITSVRNRAGELEQALEAHTAAMAHLEIELEDRSATLVRVDAELASAQNWAGQLEQALEARSAALARLETALQTQSEEAARRETELMDSRRRTAELVNALNFRSLQLRSLQTSTSWRVTEPLRRMATRFPWAFNQLRRVFRLIWWCFTLQLKPRIRDLWRRRQNVKLIASSVLFDQAWYRLQYPDVRGSADDLAAHYLQHGALEGRDPSSLFDSDWYLEQNLDVREAGINPLVHYLRHGYAEGRQSHGASWLVDYID